MTMEDGPERDSIIRAVASAPAITPPALVGKEAPRRTGTDLGAYRLGDLIGEGGMGMVYLAERSDGVYRRNVAIKILRDGLASPEHVARFLDERQLLATLDHPGIVRLLDGGTTDDGRPYLVMEHVDGVPLARHAATLPVRARVELVVRIAEALQYAHQHLVVHRDVKPSNIVVDGSGAPKLLDFGIAKLVDSDEGRAARTRTGMTLFTVEYASPEQARGEPVTVATDVYSLGAVLYELLVGRPPQAAGASPIETLANICEREPPRPSVDSDLDSIVLKALQKRAERRYPSAAALAEDLERYLAGRPVVAREATLGYRARKLVARHGGKLALGAAIAIALSATTIVSIVQARRVERRNCELVGERGWQELEAGHPDRALPYLAEARTCDDSTSLRFLIAEATRPLSREIAKLEVPGGLMSVAWSPDGARIAACGQDGLVRLYDRNGLHLADLRVDAVNVYRCTFSRDGKLLAGGDRPGRTYLWDVASGHLLHAMGGDHPVPRTDVTSGVVFSAAGDRLFTSGRDGEAHVWDVASGRSLLDLHAPDQILSLAVSADETRIATGLGGGDVIIWDASSGARLATLSGHRALVGDLRFSRDGTRLYSASWDHTARIWDVATGHAIVLTGHRLDIYGLDLSPDERHVLTGSRDGTVKIWDAASGALELELIGHDTSGTASGRFDATGARVVTAGADGMFRVWDARTGVTELMFPAIPGGGTAAHASTGPVDIRFSPDGTRLVTASGSGATLWRLDRAPLIDAIETRGRLRAVALSPDERRLATVGYENTAEVWDLAGHVRIAKLANPDEMPEDIGFSPDGARVVVAGNDRIARVHDASSGALVRTFAGHTDVINRTSFSPDGTRILTASNDRTARIWDAATGVQLAVLSHPERVMSAVWSRDGRTIATAGWDRRLRVWNVATLRPIAEIDGGTIAFLDVTFSPDGRSLASSGHGGEIDVWDIATRTRTLSIAAHNAAVTTVTWSPDGELLASTADEPIARIWDAHTGKLLATRQHPHSVMQGVWNRAGTQLVTACMDGIARVWDVHAEDRADDGALARLLAQDPYRLVDDRLEPK